MAVGEVRALGLLTTYETLEVLIMPLTISHDADADVIVVGAGHNTLIAAAYLAAAGKRVLVLERNPYVGGGVASAELTEPGFISERHAMFHTRIQANPLITCDELGLQARYGLEYIRQDVAHTALFTDGVQVQINQDVEKTVAEIAAFSSRDGDAYRQFIDRAVQMVDTFGPAQFVPPADAQGLFSRHSSTSIGLEFLRSIPLSVSDVLSEWFTDDHTLITLARFASELTLAPPGTPGTGTTLYMACGTAVKYGSGIPRGGGSAFSEACVRCITDHGGVVRTGVEVTKIVSQAGRVTQVLTADGEQLRPADAVLAAVHPHSLARLVENLDLHVARSAAATRTSLYSGLVLHASLDEPLHFPDFPDADHVVWNTLSDPDYSAVLSAFEGLAHGRLPRVPLLEAGCPTIVDSSRAPSGKGVLHSLSLTTLNLADGGPERWNSIANDLANVMIDRIGQFTPTVPRAIRRRIVVSPLDHERSSPSFVGGDYTGLAQVAGQLFGSRPTPELSGYSVPGIGGLYLCGPFMHPGGGVVGGGRATALQMFRDLDLDPRAFTT